MTIRLLTIALAASTLSFALVAAACGGDDGGGKLVDPAKADALSHQALLSEKDLPGTGWTVTKSDQFNDSGIDSDTAACKDINSREAVARSKSDAARAGRAEKELSRDTASIPTGVASEVIVFKDASTPSDVLKLFQDAVKTTNFEACLKDVVGTSVGDGTKVDTTSVSAATSAPNGGTAVAYEFLFAVQGQNLALHFETYIWRTANVGVTVTVSGTKDDVTADLVKAAVSKLQANLEALPKK